MAQAVTASTPQDQSVQQAAAEIVALINSSPRSPRQEEIEVILARIAPIAPIGATGNAWTSVLRTKIGKAIAQAESALQVSAKLHPGAECDLAEAELASCAERIEKLEDEIPNPPQCFEDLVARAEIAHYGGDVVDGKLMEAEDREDVFLGPAGRLIEAVLQFGKAIPSGRSMVAMSPAHAAHYREWRGLIETHMREFENTDDEGMTKAEINAEEDRMDAHMKTMDALAHRVFAVPARAWGDILLFAELCSWAHLGGVDPEGPNAPSELQAGFASCGEMPDLALAKLLEAIFTVAGVGQFAGEVQS